MENSMTGSRFATIEEIFSDDFVRINEELFNLNHTLDLPNHTDLNKERFNWFEKIGSKSQFYASRMWEYPFAILASDLKKEMKCADIGCGSTPFTAYMAREVGAENVTGFDPDLISDESESHFAFGIRKSFIQKTGIHFKQNEITNLDCPNNFFDRIFCISVMEHISEASIRWHGIREMARILKPGGRLIITMDLGINIPLTNPLELILYSGLIPFGSIDMAWPKERFVKMDNESMDVFGLVLYKPDQLIYDNYNRTSEIHLYKTLQKYIPPIYTNNEFQIIKDLKRNVGIFRFLVKKMLGKYS